jgi:regulator of sigma E protease
VSIGAILGKAWPFLVAVLFFGFLILTHEIGHYGTAKAFKVRVNEFSLGMGPRLLKFRKGETLYSLKAIPFGGSVLMEGEDADTEDARGFLKQKAWKRFLILVAGATVNLICGVLITVILVGMASLVGTARVHSFREDATSNQTAGGLRAGDEIRKINGQRVISSIDVGFLLSRDHDGKVDVLVRRGGNTGEVLLKDVVFPTETLENGQVVTLQDFSQLGIGRDQVSKPKYAGIVLSEGLRESVSTVRLVWLSLLDMVTGKFRFSDMAGPVGIVQTISDQAQQAQESSGNKEAFSKALQSLLFLFALISINVGVMNLLPIPALDGGRIFFCLVEMIFRKPIPKKLEAVVHGAGMLLLLAFMVVISFSDILNWVQGKR